MKTSGEFHDSKETLTVDVFIPGHEERTTTSLFHRTRLQLIERDKVCYVCGRSPEEAGPLEAHHHPIERSFANMIDWLLVSRDFPGLGSADKIDNMLLNGMLLCKDHHTHNNEGIHSMPYPIWIAQRYGKEGYKFSDIEIIHHPSQVPE